MSLGWVTCFLSVLNCFLSLDEDEGCVCYDVEEQNNASLENMDTS